MSNAPVNRRSFLGSLLAAFAFVACRKHSAEARSPQISFANPLAANPNYDLGLYHITELGPGLYLPVDITKTFHGYADAISVRPGDDVSLYLSGPPNIQQTLSLANANGHHVATYTADVDFQQIGSKKPWVDGFKYNKTTTIKLPNDLKSGLYRLTGDIPLICKGNNTSADITVVYPSNTLNAYNHHGGKSLYRPADLATEHAIYRATVVSHLRYNPLAPDYAENFVESFFQWMEKQHYNTRYIADNDLEDYSQIANSKIVILTGKSEYWTRQARHNIDKFIAAGKNVLVLSGNTMYWQVRYNNQKDLMICYKSNNVDPMNDTIYSTYYWDTPGFKYPVRSSIGADFKGGGFPMKLASPMHGFKIVNAASPLLKGTGLKNGDLLHLPTVETDGAPLKKMILPGSSEIPEIDNGKLNFHKIELIGYIHAVNPDDKPGLGTFIAFQKTHTSGTVVNVASTNWCSATGMGGVDKEKIETITKNMIERSLNNESLFAS